MKKLLLIWFLIIFGISTFWCKPYPKESMSELKRKMQIAWNNNEDITPYKEDIRLKTLQLAPETSLLNQEDVYYDMKLLSSGQDYQIGLSNCEENLFQSGCDYKAIGKYNLHRCLEEKRQGKLIRVGYCTPSADGWIPKYRASAHDIALWNYIDNTVKVAYKKYKQDQEAKARDAEKKRKKALEKKEMLKKKIGQYNKDPYTVVLNLTPVKKYRSFKSKGVCNNIPQIKVKTMIEECNNCFYDFNSKIVVEVSSEEKECNLPYLFYTDQNKQKRWIGEQERWHWCDPHDGLQIENRELVCDDKYILNTNMLIFIQDIKSRRLYNLYSYTYQHNIEKKKEYLQLLEENHHLRD